MCGGAKGASYRVSYLGHLLAIVVQFFIGGEKDLVLLRMLKWTILLTYVSAVTAGNRWVSFWYGPASYGGSDINATVRRYEYSI